MSRLNDLRVPGVQPADIAVVVPVGGAAPEWRRSATSLSRLDPAPGELVVVIDGPDGERAAAAAEIGARIVELAERGGPARARNHGVRATSAGVVLFVDADVEVPPDLVGRTAHLFNLHGDVAALFGSYDEAPSDPGLLSRYRNLLHHFVHQRAREAASTFWAGCGAIRRAAFDDVGGFNERYSQPSIEDIELGGRLVRAGHAIRLVRSLQVKHLKGWRLREMLATDLWRRAVPWTTLMLRTGMIDDLNVTWRSRVSVGLAFVLLAALVASWAWWPLIVFSAAALGGIVMVNAELFRFFRRTGGMGFAMRTVPLYCLYLMTSGLGFGLGLVAHLRRRSR